MPTETFNYTGADQSWIVPVGVTEAVIECWGAAGTGNTNGNGGLGGYAKGVYTVVAGETLTVKVGGYSGEGAGGWNGGADGNGGSTPTNAFRGGGGGGASDVRRALDRLIVAGGGGGAGSSHSQGTKDGGAGGADVGQNGYGITQFSGDLERYQGGGGGTQSSGGSGGDGKVYFGAGDTNGNDGSSGLVELGGDGAVETLFIRTPGELAPANDGGGGGGGGYYGGGGGGGGGSDYREQYENSKAYPGGGGGGGSCFVGTGTSTAMTRGVQSGHGKVVITYAITATPPDTTLLLPADGSREYLSGAGDAYFDWSYVDGNLDAQAGWYFRRSTNGGLTYEYWNATTQAFQLTEVMNSGTGTDYTFPAGVWVEGTEYQWSVASQDDTGLKGSYADNFTVTAAETISSDPSTISGSGSISASSVLDIFAAASLSGAGGLSVDSFVKVIGALTAGGSGSVTASGARATFGTIEMMGFATQEAAGFSKTFPDAVTLSATGTLSAEGLRRVVPDAIDLTGTGSLVGAGYVTVNGVAVLVADGSVTVDSLLNVLGTASITGEGLLHADAGTVLNAIGSISVDGLVNIQAGASLVADSTIEASADVTHIGSATLGGAGDVDAAATLEIFAISNTSAAGTVSAEGESRVPGEATLNAEGTMAVSGYVIALMLPLSLEGEGGLAASILPENWDVILRTPYGSAEASVSTTSLKSGDVSASWDVGDVGTEPI